MSFIPSVRASPLLWSVCVLAKQNVLPDFMSRSCTHVQTRGYAVFHDFDPGTSGVSESQNVPVFTTAKRLLR